MDEELKRCAACGAGSALVVLRVPVGALSEPDDYLYIGYRKCQACGARGGWRAAHSFDIAARGAEVAWNRRTAEVDA